MRYLLAATLAFELVALVPTIPDHPRLVSPSTHAAYCRLLPDSEDGVLQALRTDPKLLWYTDREMPPLFQHWEPTSDTGFQFGVVPVRVNISAEAGEPFGNANREFPWAATAGLTPDHPVVRFALLPGPAKVTWETLPNVNRFVLNRVRWTYPDGTTFGEVLLVTHPTTKEKYATEVRLRKKANGAWTGTAYRPFPTGDDLRAAFGDIARDDAATLAAALDKPQTKTWLTKSAHPHRTAFEGTAAWETLPPVWAETVVKLLDRPFKDAAGKAWRSGSGAVTHAPTTDADFHIVPKAYGAAPIEVGRQGCVRCHDTAGEEAKAFDAVRGWYGRVRGDDTVFSFHPFDPVLGGKHHTNTLQSLPNRALAPALFVWP